MPNTTTPTIYGFCVFCKRKCAESSDDVIETADETYTVRTHAHPSCLRIALCEDD